jgi:hypothetical protein
MVQPIRLDAAIERERVGAFELVQASPLAADALAIGFERLVRFLL